MRVDLDNLPAGATLEAEVRPPRGVRFRASQPRPWWARWRRPQVSAWTGWFQPGPEPIALTWAAFDFSQPAAEKGE